MQNWAHLFGAFVVGEFLSKNQY